MLRTPAPFIGALGITMFSKKTKSETVNLTAGWTLELIQAVLRYPTDHGLGFPSNDFLILIDAFVLDSNNFEVERRAYGHLEVAVGANRTNANIPVVVSFVLDDELNSWFKSRLEDPEIATVAGLEYVYGKAILNGRNSRDGNREICMPVFEWNLYLSEGEWKIVAEAARLAEKSNSLRLGVRIGLPHSVTEQTVVNDSMNTRLLIHRIWITSTAVISAKGLQSNAAFLSDMVE